LAAEQIGKLEMAAAQIGVARERGEAALLVRATQVIDGVAFHKPSPEPDTRGP
jgi:hypothetical protein